MKKSNPYGDQKFHKLLEILKRFEKSNKEISIQDLVETSGYKISAIRTYVGKKLRGFVLYPTRKGYYSVVGAIPLSESAFSKHMSQKSPILDAKDLGLKPRLLKRSLDACLLAIELYNRPTQPNRVESFCIMMINAWELILKASIISHQGESALFYKDDSSRSISIRDAIKLEFPKNNDPVRKNVELLADLRDKAIHLLIPELQGDISRAYQSSIFNYMNYYSKITESNISSILNIGLISLIIDSEKLNVDIIKRTYDKTTSNEVDSFMQRFYREEEILNSPNFAIPVEYKLTLTKNQNHGDITLSSGVDGASGYFIEVPKDVDKTHPHRQKDAIQEITKRLNNITITSYDFQAILHKENIRNCKSNQYYYFIEKPETHRYSNKLIDLITDKITKDHLYIYRCKTSYKSRNK